MIKKYDSNKDYLLAVSKFNQEHKSALEQYHKLFESKDVSTDKIIQERFNLAQVFAKKVIESHHYLKSCEPMNESIVNYIFASIDAYETILSNYTFGIDAITKGLSAFCENFAREIDKIKKDEIALTIAFMSIFIIMLLLFDRIAKKAGSKQMALVYGFALGFQVLAPMLFMRPEQEYVSNFNTPFADLDELTLAIITIFIFPILEYANKFLHALLSKLLLIRFSKEGLLKSANRAKLLNYYLAGMFAGLIISLLIIWKKHKFRDMKAFTKFLYKTLKTGAKMKNTSGRQSYDALTFFVLFVIFVFLFSTPMYAVFIYIVNKYKDSIIDIRQMDKVDPKTKKKLKSKSNEMAKKLKPLTKKIAAKSVTIHENALSAFFSVFATALFKKDSGLNLFKAISLSIKALKEKPKILAAYSSKHVERQIKKTLRESTEEPTFKVGMRVNSDAYNNKINVKTKAKEEVIEIIDTLSARHAFRLAVDNIMLKLIENGFRVAKPIQFIFTNQTDIYGYTTITEHGHTIVISLALLTKLLESQPIINNRHIEAVLAHELGHIFHDDVRTFIILYAPFMGTFLILGSLLFTFNLLNKYVSFRFIATIYMTLLGLIFLRISREAEIRADAFAISLGYQQEMYDLMQAFQGGSDFLAALDEHGSDKDRINALEDVIKYLKTHKK